MKKLLVVLGILSAACLSAQPKVAVLDAVIPDTMDTSVIVPITDKIAEELVNARKYSVLDRANVEQVLREREFQVSGLVQDDDIKEAGKYLGADFVVISRVSLVEDTYFISARMINVETGAVEAQVSDQAEGRASVLIQIASRVGKKLATGTVEKVVEPVADETKPDIPPATTATRTPKLFVGVEVGLPMFLGEFSGLMEDWTDYWTQSAGYFDTGLSTLGVSATLAYQPVSILYVGASLDYATQSLSYDGTTEGTASHVALQGAVGVTFALGKSLHLYAGGKVGFGVLALGDFWNSDNWTLSWDGLGSSGLGYGLEVGARLLLFNFVTLGARMEFMATSIGGDTDLGSSGYFDTVSDSYGFSTLRLHVGAGIALGK